MSATSVTPISASSTHAPFPSRIWMSSIRYTNHALEPLKPSNATKPSITARNNDTPPVIDGRQRGQRAAEHGLHRPQSAFHEGELGEEREVHGEAVAVPAPLVSTEHGGAGPGRDAVHENRRSERPGLAGSS